MDIEFDEIKNKFYKIKRMGWVKGDINNLGSIGNTFENLIGIPNNELEIPDFNQIEIKTKSKHSDSYTTLFNCTPTGPHYHETERLKDIYGYPDSILKKCKVLNTTVSSKTKTKVGLDFYFEIKVNNVKEKIYLFIYDKKKNLIENIVYWDFYILKEKLYRKLRYLAFIKALNKKLDSYRMFKYYEMKIYKLKTFDTFIDMLDKGIIKISIKIGIYRDDKRKGKIHDHGTSFCIKEENLDKLYDLIATYK